MCSLTRGAELAEHLHRMMTTMASYRGAGSLGDGHLRDLEAGLEQLESDGRYRVEVDE